MMNQRNDAIPGSDSNEERIRPLVEALQEIEDGLILVVTGAGVSVASGLATFRGTDPGAVWKRDVTELGTVGYFRRDPVGSWQWYLDRFDGLLDAKPNPAHRALVAIERWQRERGGRFLLVTQNIDTLHETAGSEQLIKVHGTADRARCSRDGCALGAPAGSISRARIDLAPFRRQPSGETLPKCPRCGSLLRQHVLWFDELYDGHQDYQWHRVQQELGAMRLALCIGTSFSVGVTELVLRSAAMRGVPVFSIDPAAGGAPRHYGIQPLIGRAEELLPAVCAQLGAAAVYSPPEEP